MEQKVSEWVAVIGRIYPHSRTFRDGKYIKRIRLEPIGGVCEAPLQEIATRLEQPKPTEGLPARLDAPVAGNRGKQGLRTVQDETKKIRENR